MRTTHPAGNRRGYSLTVVLLFLVLLFWLWAAVYRSTASLIRVETARATRDNLDAGMMNALAQGLMYFEKHYSDLGTSGAHDLRRQSLQ